MIPATELTNRQPNIDEFATALAEHLSIPDSLAFHILIQNWAHWEFSAAENNPLDTEQSFPGSTDYNSLGVKNYPLLADGVSATIETMQNGLYPNLLSCLSQIGTPAVNTDWLHRLISDINVWGTGNATVSFPWTQDMNTNPDKYISSFSQTGMFTDSPAPVTPIIDATLEGRVTALEQSVAALNTAILAREHAQATAADTFAHAMDVAADPAVIPHSP